eukprot:CAMPEP_0172700710 /NCGR_PEP_ID=MMETSP1074-20121228/31106_1 /TAXON_ID=2916 /ORGANISM="Ceratium fusus, Strain PA161109" /LENGTH=56 /DNA_ID=CAMNT_0013522137 /DNA_START=25 /DNA_END=195 /DNA_ORIENTATION=+
MRTMETMTTLVTVMPPTMPSEPYCYDLSAPRHCGAAQNKNETVGPDEAKGLEHLGM